ncbi:MAG: CSLREA domain-containing protein [Acidobacteriota bacterium]
MADAALAATITVNTAADDVIAGDGACTLREALINSNGDTESTSGDCVQGSGRDEIHFNIPGAGPHVISISASGGLPEIIAPVVIDGSTQPGNDSVCGAPIPDRPTYQVVLEDGALISSGVRFAAGSDGSTIRGLNIRGFDDEQVDIASASSIIIACNFLGSDETGTSQAAGNGNAISVFNGNSIFVGGTGPGNGNLLTAASSGSSGISLTSAGANNSIQYNFIGTDKTGTLALPNEFGILYFPQTGGQTQENFKISSNLISGNAFAGVAFDTVDGLEMRRNLIGTDLTGTLPLGNGAQGIVAGFVSSGDSPAIIGGTGASDGNTIAFNGADGILVNDSPTTIQGNSIFSNGEQGIDLGNDGPNINDGGDGDSGVNSLQNSPFLLPALAAKRNGEF